jgi:MFS family permease
VLVGLVLMKTPTQQKRRTAQMTLSSLGEGIRFVRRSEILFSTMLLDFVSSFFASASTLYPVFAHEILRVGPRGLGLLYSAQSVGAVVAGAGMSFVGDLRRKGRLILWALALYGAATALYGMSDWFVLSLLLLAVAGGADTFSTILRNTLRQLMTPDQLRGRMAAVNMVFARGGPQLGNMEAGLVAAWIGAPLSVITGGLATLMIVGMVAWRVPQLWNRQNG